MSNTDTQTSITEKLLEFRSRLVRIAISIAVGFAASYLLRNYLFQAIKRPLDSAKVNWVAMNPFESFLVMLRLSLYGGIIMALPVVLYQICAFVFPSLTRTQRKAVQLLLLGGFLLAVTGIAIAYLGVFPNIMPYLLTFTPAGVESQMRMGETVSILLIALLGFAIAFQFPMLLLALVYLELVQPSSLVRHWRYWMVGIAVGSAFFVPPDPFSLLFMTIPLWTLYWLSIGCAYLIVRKKKSTALTVQ